MNTSATSSSSHVPYLCLEHEALMNFVIMGGAITLFLGMFMILLCMVCRRRAAKEKMYTERLKKKLRKQKREETGGILSEDEEEEQGLGDIELQPTASIPFGPTRDYSELAKTGD